jgi:competence protein ComEA
MKRKIHPLRQRAANGLLLACLLSLGLALVASTAQAARPESAAPPLSGVVNVNTATPDELQLLPGVGASRAEAIVAHRKERGGFKSVEDLMEVKGIGESMLERMRPFVTVTGKTTARKL